MLSSFLFSFAHTHSSSFSLFSIRIYILTFIAISIRNLHLVLLTIFHSSTTLCFVVRAMRAVHMYLQYSMIEEMRCFTVSPTHATLLPGDVLTVTITYEHHSLLFDGCHSMPLLMKLGKL